MIVMWFMLGALAGWMVGALNGTGYGRLYWSIAVGVGGLIFSFAESGSPAGFFILMAVAYGVGMAIALVQVRRHSEQDAAEFNNEIATASSEDLHMLIESHLLQFGDAGVAWMKDRWLAMPTEEQRKWVDTHRARIKQLLRDLSLDDPGRIGELWEGLARIDSQTSHESAST